MASKSLLSTLSMKDGRSGSLISLACGIIAFPLLSYVFDAEGALVFDLIFSSWRARVILANTGILLMPLRQRRRKSNCLEENSKTTFLDTSYALIDGNKVSPNFGTMFNFISSLSASDISSGLFGSF